MSLNLIPRGGRIIVQRDEADTKTASGIFIPNGEKKTTGIVVAAAEKSKDGPTPPAVGTRVLFSKYGGTAFEWEKQEYLLLEEHDLIAIVPESPGGSAS